MTPATTWFLPARSASECITVRHRNSLAGASCTSMTFSLAGVIGAGPPIRNLLVDADRPSKRRKQLGENPLAPWELRLGDYRVFYEIEDDAHLKIVAVGHKEHNDLYIGGEKVQL